MYSWASRTWEVGGGHMAEEDIGEMDLEQARSEWWLRDCRSRHGG